MTLEAFNGDWVLTAEENSAKFLEAAGMSWIMRKAAGAAGYGVGKGRHIITVEGDNFTVTLKTPIKTDTTTVSLSSTEYQPCKDLQDEPTTCLITVTDGVIENRLAEKNGKVLSVKRYLQDGKMLLDLSIAGVNSRRTFTKQ